MNKIISLIFLLFVISESFSQEIKYTSKGNISNAENKKISSNQVRELLKNHPKLLYNYNIGRDKKTIGNILLIAGPLLIVSDLIKGSTSYSGPESGSQKTYPTVLTYLGFSAIIIAIPIKIGFTKKIKNVVSEFNSLEKVGFEPNDKEFYFISNSNGIGLRMTLN